ncbi:NAD-dependent epimerase/dehydratase family protein [Pseudoteredinibacter isoporae]|uniref:Nucleoside-diphosphate-sugar epimerase n=1 Tax=Pseudoteredinibacter isoporae TaxID=570281 RepID=A0A7X0JTC5_9GAMM|nr:NAD-dependent epimerase/dehydratase family protein [Pseudoteredinibacter isoporae]MBB6521782.1 nucleoside-diphosphate-sugar epimerase [Pseudoteredinibacter isoporae]NHO87328.1 NAD-dependent epimerase/dehydratase family protein [Pseudoteredinibacter isoporae]NIB23040.1 NAD-dependent epimerase/dehydratase family protein [Pseudoteredinibacter isoporae]
MAIVISGSSGFVGQALIQQLSCKAKWQEQGLRTLCRQLPDYPLDHVQYAVISGSGETWHTDQLETHIQVGDCIVHLAGRAHQGSSCPEEEAQLQLAAHLDLTQALAQAAANRKAKRFIYISSAKVFAECSGDKVFDAKTAPQPEDPYARAKWQTEQWLQSFCPQHHLELIILRPGLVYDRHAKGNIARLQSLIRTGLPLPLGGLSNQRNMISLANFCHLIEHCVDCPQPEENTCIAADSEALSSSQFLSLLAKAEGRSLKLFTLPDWLLNMLRRLPGFEARWLKLSSNFALNNQPCNIALGWVAPFTPEQSLLEHSFAPSQLAKQASKQTGEKP